MKTSTLAEESIIGRIIKYSQYIVKLRVAIASLFVAHKYVESLGIPSIKFNDYLNLVDSINGRKKELQAQIKILLYPVLKGHNFQSDLEDGWYLSRHDLKCGYAELKETLSINGVPDLSGPGRDWILLLSDTSDGKFKAGSLVLKKEVEQYLTGLKGHQTDLNDHILDIMLKRLKARVYKLS